MYLRQYETVILVDPDSGQDGIDKVLERSREALKKTEAKEIRVENWGVRKLAYELNRRTRGAYLYLQFLGSNATVAELERLLKITEPAFKYQTVLLDAHVDPDKFDFVAASDERTLLARKRNQAEKDAKAAEEDAREAEAAAAEERAATEKAAAIDAPAVEAGAEEAPAEEEAEEAPAEEEAEEAPAEEEAEEAPAEEEAEEAPAEAEEAPQEEEVPAEEEAAEAPADEEAAAETDEKKEEAK